MKKILVLGGNGFIGSSLIRSFYDKYQFTCLDLGNQNIVDLKNVRYISGDWQFEDVISNALNDIDLVIHLISTTIPASSYSKPAYDVQSNLLGSIQLFEKMHEKNIKRIIFLSSGGAVYGDQKISPISEESATHPISPYAIIKLTIEQYLQFYSRERGLSPLIFRVANPYGLGPNKIGVQGIIPTIFHHLQNNEAIKIWGDGSHVRDYIYIDDVLNAINLGIDKSHEGIFNLGSGIGVSTRDLIRLAEMTTGIKAKLIFEEPRSCDVQKVILDCSKISKIFGWKPTTSIENGLNLYWNQLTTKSR